MGFELRVQGVRVQGLSVLVLGFLVFRGSGFRRPLFHLERLLTHNVGLEFRVSGLVIRNNVLYT